MLVGSYTDSDYCIADIMSPIPTWCIVKHASSLPKRTIRSDTQHTCGSHEPNNVPLSTVAKMIIDVSTL